MEEEQSQGCLLVVWAAGIRLYLLNEYPDEGIVIGASAFKRYRPGQHLYLVDWLRQPNGQVSGIRFAVGTDALPVARWLADRPGVRVAGDLVFEISFPGFSSDPYHSEEEQFVGHDVLRAADGSFALAVELLGVEEEDVRRLGARGLP